MQSTAVRLEPEEWASPFRSGCGTTTTKSHSESAPPPWAEAALSSGVEFDVREIEQPEVRGELEDEEKETHAGTSLPADAELFETDEFIAEENLDSDECCGHDTEAFAPKLEESFESEAEDYALDDETVATTTVAEYENEKEFDSEEARDWENEWQHEQQAAPQGLTAGSAVIDKVPLLRAHRGIGPDLILMWNEIPTATAAVDVVVHLHGYSLSPGSRLHIVRDVKPRSGLDWSDPARTSTLPGRTRPTLALLPRGHFYGGKSDRAYSFPALATVNGIPELVDFGLRQLAALLGVAIVTRGRLVLTAHSGGGGALLKILRFVDPHEVHVFDGLYQNAESLSQWAARRILHDQATTGTTPERQRSYMSEQGGALRVLFRPGTKRSPGTALNSRAVVQSLATLIAPDSSLRHWYRVESTAVEHLRIPPVYGWRLLADASAELPNAAAEPGASGQRALQREFEEQFSLDGEGETITRTGALVSFRSGETLPVIVGPTVASKSDDYFDPVASGNPLLDTSGVNKTIRLSTSFTVKELTTSGGRSADVARIDPKLVDCLQRLRDHVNKGITITSGFRSWKRNREVYAARNQKPTLSQHCAGRAADIKIGGMNGLDIAKAAIDAYGPNIGIGVGDTFAHIDVRGLAQAWNYGGATKDWVLEVKRYQHQKGGTSVAASPPATAKTTTGSRTSSPSTARPPGPSASQEFVRFAQRVLNAAESERLDTDGLFGTHTRGAVARFRHKYALGPGDTLDSRTQLALAQRGLEELAQQSMFQLGVLDDKTRQALVDFKRNRGTGSDATLDVATVAALGQALEKRSAGIAAPSSPALASSAAPIARGRASLGIDTASVAGNKDPNWAQAKVQVPIDFAIIRSNWGVSPDSVFKRDWPRMKDAGLVRGAYLFLRFPHPKYQMKAPDPAAQAKAMIATVGALEASDLPPTLDVEFPGEGGIKLTGMTPEQVLDGVRVAWKILRDHYGVAPIVYTSARVWREDLHDLPAPDLVESPLWLARYPHKPGPAVYDAARVAALRVPPVPRPWGDATNWWIHQYQGDGIQLPGFPTGNIDMNKFNIMTNGTTGDRVRWVQRRLGIPETGAYDDAMEATVRTFQRTKGLPEIGNVGPSTFAYLCWSHIQ